MFILQICERSHLILFVSCCNAIVNRSIDMNRKTHPCGLDGRTRDHDGEIRHKNGNTRVDTLRDTYGETFAAGVRGDMHLDTLLDKTGARSLREFLKSKGR